MVSIHFRNGNDNDLIVNFKTNQKNLLPLHLGDVVVQKTTVRTDIKGRLLTPEEGCGQSIFPYNNRIVGGAPAVNGKTKLKKLNHINLNE